MFLLYSFVLHRRTRFKQLREWNILLAVSFVEMVKEEYQVELNKKDFLYNDTIEDLYRCVCSRQ